MKKVLIIYTGGTIGMMRDNKKKSLVPVNFEMIADQVPELRHLNCNISHQSLTPIDSSNVQPEFWEELAGIIWKTYSLYDGFVILHGTDTMAYTASALSFMFTNLSKPVILTGSQLPLGVIRTDAKRNLITAIEIAVAKEIVPEVCIYFNSQLFRGNRAEKFTSSQFDAFHSLNYPVLAEVGVNIEYNKKAIKKHTSKKFSVSHGFDSNVALIKIFPGMQPSLLSAVSSKKNLKGIILETYGSGNAPTSKEFLKSIEDAIKKNIIILNISQCSGGTVDQGKYETSAHLKKFGVISGGDMTTEAAITKLMFLLNKNYSREKIRIMMETDVAGER
jgi:L-asparaginase